MPSPKSSRTPGPARGACHSTDHYRQERTNSKLKPPRRYRTAEFSIRRTQEPHTPKHVSESRVIACTAGPILSTRESAILVLMLTKIPSKSHRAFTQAILSKRDFAIALIIRMCDRTRKSKDSTSSFCPSYP